MLRVGGAVATVAAAQAVAPCAGEAILAKAGDEVGRVEGATVVAPATYRDDAILVPDMLLSCCRASGQIRSPRHSGCRAAAAGVRRPQAPTGLGVGDHAGFASGISGGVAILEQKGNKKYVRNPETSTRASAMGVDRPLVGSCWEWADLDGRQVAGWQRANRRAVAQVARGLDGRHRRVATRDLSTGQARGPASRQPT